MELRWPGLRPELLRDGRFLIWVGQLRGVQMEYQVQIQLDRAIITEAPLAFVLHPKIRPRPGGTYEEIPHLRFFRDDPTASALCLYDPNGREWNPTMSIADTIVPWTSEWLHHYECWHLDGVWRGENAPGPISVAEMNSKELAGDGQQMR